MILYNIIRSNDLIWASKESCDIDIYYPHFMIDVKSWNIVHLICPSTHNSWEVGGSSVIRESLQTPHTNHCTIGCSSKTSCSLFHCHSWKQSIHVTNILLKWTTFFPVLRWSIWGRGLRFGVGRWVEQGGKGLKLPWKFWNNPTVLLRGLLSICQEREKYQWAF